MRFFRIEELEIDFEDSRIRTCVTIDKINYIVGDWHKIHFEELFFQYYGTYQKVKDAYKQYLFDKEMKKMLTEDR